MNAEIIAVGSELLLGQINNTNAKFLSTQLAELGINVFFHTVVGDNSERLKNVLEIAESRSNLIILTGGLGPTKDDLTKETISRHLDMPLVMDEEALDSIVGYYKKRGREMTENNKKQALVIEGSTVLPNEHGMAPGMMVEKGESVYMLFPGPPKEMEPMFRKFGYKHLLDKLDIKERIDSKVLRFFGIGESLLETKVDDLLVNQSNPTLAPLAADGEVKLRITAKDVSKEKTERLISDMEKEIRSRVGEFCYGEGETSLMKEAVKELSSKRYTIAAAESLTGGMFQEELTAISGAGLILKGGIVSYTNEAKMKLLKIKEETIEKFGVVSEECAAEMAENIRELTGSDVGMSFTGVAGPDTLEGQPVGTVYIGISLKGKATAVRKLNLSGSRAQIRIRTVKYGCHYLLQELGLTNH
ncbi:competence/damage-inducible protein A [Peribacillus kribbensis]|uniref:competence/damage-inducible protein A n=1 Tax=Peribacillus kribbensis TaxID=356658 RepID=UPI0004037A47|nr:competence/damage-inducible protein A [Peribacillus kribbensis]